MSGAKIWTLAPPRLRWTNTLRGRKTDCETRPTRHCLSLRVHGQRPAEGPVHTPYGGYHHAAFPQGYGRLAKDPHVHSSDSLPLNQPGEPSWSPSSLYKPGCRGRATGPVPASKSRFPECFGCSSSHRRPTQDGRAEPGFSQDRRFESRSAPPFLSWPEGRGRDVQVSPRAAPFQAWDLTVPLQSRRREPVGPAPPRHSGSAPCNLQGSPHSAPCPPATPCSRVLVPQPRAPWKLSWLSTAHQLCTRRSPLRAGAHTGWEGGRRLGGARAPVGSLWPRTQEGHAPQPRANSPPTCSRPTRPSAQAHRSLFTQVREGRATADGSHQRRSPESRGRARRRTPTPRGLRGKQLVPTGHQKCSLLISGAQGHGLEGLPAPHSPAHWFLPV